MATNWGMEVEEFGTNLLDTANVLIGSYGQQAANAAASDAAAIERTRLNNVMALEREKEKQRTNEKIIDLAKKGLFILAFLGVAFLAYKYAVKSK